MSGTTAEKVAPMARLPTWTVDVDAAGYRSITYVLWSWQPHDDDTPDDPPPPLSNSDAERQDAA